MLQAWHTYHFGCNSRLKKSKVILKGWILQLFLTIMASTLFLGESLNSTTLIFAVEVVWMALGKVDSEFRTAE